MAGTLIVSNLTTDTDNTFIVRSNTGTTLFSANTTGIDVANSIGATAITNDKILSIANTKISGNIISSQITSVANTQITGNIISSQIAPSVTLTTPIISGNLNLDSAGTTGIRVPSANTIALHTAGTQQAGITSAGLLQFNSGYGSSATAYGCRAWVNFNGSGTPVIRGSGNVSSITDHGTADYTVNFTTNMVDDNYAVMYGGAIDWRTIGASGHSNITVSGVRLLTRLPSNANASEVDDVALAVFR